MRGFLIFLAFAVPVLLANPVFWWLVQAEVGAAPSVIVESDGVSRHTTIGPRSPWPEWARLPAAGEVTPHAYYAAAPGHPAMGHGEIALSAPSPASIAALARALEAEGWAVTAVRYRVAEPTLPPTPLLVCALTARRGAGADERTMVFGFQLAPLSGAASVAWREGPPLPSWHSTQETLPAWTEPQAGC